MHALEPGKKQQTICPPSSPFPRSQLNLCLNFVSWHDQRNKTFARTFQTLYIAPILSIYTAVPFWQYYTEWKIVGWLKGRRKKRKVFDSRVRLLCFGTCFYIRHALCKRIVQLVEKNLHFQVAPLDFNIQLIVWIAIVILSESEQCHHKLDVS